MKWCLVLVKIENTIKPLIRSSQETREHTFKFLIHDAHLALEREIGDYSSLKLEHITLKSFKFKGSQPPALDQGSTRRIEFADTDASEWNVIVFLEQIEENRGICCPVCYWTYRRNGNLSQNCQKFMGGYNLSRY
jgi:hypothetical protein